MLAISCLHPSSSTPADPLPISFHILKDEDKIFIASDQTISAAGREQLVLIVQSLDNKF
jgi:hypothetical protein